MQFPKLSLGWCLQAGSHQIEMCPNHLQGFPCMLQDFVVMSLGLVKVVASCNATATKQTSVRKDGYCFVVVGSTIFIGGYPQCLFYVLIIYILSTDIN